MIDHGFAEVSMSSPLISGKLAMLADLGAGLEDAPKARQVRPCDPACCMGSNGGFGALCC